MVQQIGNVIGKGGYGKVFKGLNMRNGQFVAIKEVVLSQETQDDLPMVLVSYVDDKRR